MTADQEFAALRSICPDASLRQRSLGDWYVSLPYAERKDGGMLVSLGESDATPEGAIRATWLSIVAKPTTIVLRAYGNDRRTVRWNGFMWEDER